MLQPAERHGTDTRRSPGLTCQGSPEKKGRLSKPPNRRTSHLGLPRDAIIAAWLIAPGRQMTSPFMQASKPCRATSRTSPTRKPGISLTLALAFLALLSIGVAVMPGQRAVTVRKSVV